MSDRRWRGMARRQVRDTLPGLRSMRFAWMFSCLLLLAATLNAHAQNEVALAGWFERLDRTIIVQSDGSFIELIEEEFAIEPHGDELPDIVQRVLHWNGSAGSMELLEAATLKPDGRKIPAPPEMQFEENRGQDNGLDQDQRFRVISFIDFEPGDRILLRARHQRTVPFFPGQFSEMRTVPVQPVRQMHITYDLPASMRLHHDAIGFELEQVSTVADRRREQWRHTGQRRAHQELRAVAASDYADRLIVSTMSNHAQLARAYRADAAPMAQPDHNIRKLAAQLVAGKQGQYAMAQAIHRWMQKNIVYGGRYLGRASVVPNPASQTLQARQGDCKDHATLFEALLSAVGIESSPVLINASNAYQIGKVPTLGLFNHVMTWIPALQLFVDSSAHDLAFGQLPAPLSDKPALIVKEERVARTPMRGPKTQTIDLQVVLGDDADAQITLNETAGGWLAVERRRMFAEIAPFELVTIGESMLMASGLSGDVWLEQKNASQAGDTALQLSAQASGLVGVDEPASLRLVSSIGTGIGSALADYASFRSHRAPFICVAAQINESAAIQLPAALRPGRLPKGIHINAPGFEFRSSYRLQGNRIQIQRSLHTRFASNVCSPDRFEQLKILAARVFDDLAASVPVTWH